jgi:hypothetical protein
VETSEAPFKQDLAGFNASIESISSGTHEFLWHRHRMLYIGTIALACLISAPFLYLTYLGAVSGYDIRGTLLLAALPFIMPGMYYATVSARMEKIFYEQLSTALGFSYSVVAPYDTAKGYIFTLGYGIYLSNVLTGTYRGMPLRLFRYTYSIGQGKERHYYNHGVCELTVPYTLPELLVKSHSFGETYIRQPKGTVPLRLEGPFNNKFDVYICEGKQIEALQVLEPDTMATLMDEFDGYGFECSADRVNIFTNARTYSKSDYQKMVQLADTVFDKLIPELSRL